MLYTFPDYYKEFHCTADQCEDTCCAGWQIVIDPGAQKYYRGMLRENRRRRKEKRITPDFAGRLKKGIDWKNGIFCQNEEKRCAFLNDRNLCDLYTNLGEKSLCRTCRRYPRHVEEFENVREVTLSVSCPEVAALLMNRQTPVTFFSVERDGEEEFDDFDPFLYSLLEDGREVLYEILQDRSRPVDVRISRALNLAKELQRCVDEDALFSGQEVLAAYRTAQETAPLRHLKSPFDFSRKMTGLAYRLERLRDDWENFLRESMYLLYGKGETQYRRSRTEFIRWMEEYRPDYEICREQLLVYFISAYFCGAVYDGRIVKKVRMAVASVFLLQEFWMACWLKNGKNLNIQDMTEIVYRYSRELEHSDENLEQMERML
ncbi:MAG: flagellin lysine-N-methylase [Blautia sp.]|nr:flagellin lysine-N-methylase [Blautia sp.]MDY5031157.1 flagellin lysine-N-methylase [Blautia sp.]